MKRDETLELLDALMEGGLLSEARLDDLLCRKVDEGLHLDYKHGKELADQRKGAVTLRQYISAFANSAGGTLIVGVDRASRSVTGCAVPRGGDVSEWTSRCLTPIAPYLSPSPRIHTLKHSHGLVLVAAVYRSSALVPVAEGGQLAYYVRIGDQTLKAPTYLMADLVLGRRATPRVRIGSVSLTSVSFERAGTDELMRLDLHFSVENEGLSWATDVRVGIVSWVVGNTGYRLPSLLASSIDLATPGTEFPRHSVQHRVGPMRGEAPMTISPFSVKGVGNFGAFAIPATPIGYTWKAAAYVISPSSLPVWYQMSSIITDRQTFSATENRDKQIVLDELGPNERPTVAWMCRPAS